MIGEGSCFVGVVRRRPAFVIRLRIGDETRWFQKCTWEEKATHWFGSQNNAVWEPTQFINQAAEMAAFY